MMLLCAALAFFLSFAFPSWAAEPDAGLSVDLNDAAALQEATRVLEAELKLAAKPNTYLLIDLVNRAILMKGRGVELHRVPIEDWTASNPAELASTFRLRERPPITRRKIGPTVAGEQEPISLADMPMQYALHYTPALTILVQSYRKDNLWQWALQTGRVWYQFLKTWASILSTGDPSPSIPWLRLTLAPDQAQSLAWVTTDGMPLLIRRTTDK